MARGPGTEGQGGTPPLAPAPYLATGDPASSGAGAELSVCSWQPAGGRCSLSQSATLRLTEEPQAPTGWDPGPRTHFSSHGRVLPQPLCDLSKVDDPF